jgi:hypothetical protein
MGICNPLPSTQPPVKKPPLGAPKAGPVPPAQPAPSGAPAAPGR